MENKRPIVCLVLEGSYPFITGGVSAWVHQLIQGIPQVDFKLYTLSPKAAMERHYPVLPNLIEHKDIVISQKFESKQKPRHKTQMLSSIEKIHQQFSSGSQVDFAGMLKLLPENYFLYQDAIKTDQGWDLIVKNNQSNNPVYPFADYFWAWKGFHDTIFTILGSSLPQADMYHAISTGYAGLASIVAKLRYQKPFILTEHGLYHKEREMEIRRASFVRGYQRDMYINMFNQLSRLCYSHADIVISLFEYNRQKQIELGAREDNTVIIPNGIDTDFYSNIEKELKPGFHVGLVARVVPIKDVKTFITMAKIVSESIPEAEFYCIGPTDEDQGYYDDCRMLVQSFHLTEKFHFTGKADVRKYYAFLDVLLLTSVREAQPLVILEAYCADIPVVATKVGNVPELLDYDERFLAASKDPEKLANGVKFIYEHPQTMSGVIDKNKQKVFKFYNRNELHQRYKNLYFSFEEQS